VPPIRSRGVCRLHGGEAPQVKAAVKRRLDQAADALVARLLGFALDGDAPTRWHCPQYATRWTGPG
jgi:hypothetical protein